MKATFLISRVFISLCVMLLCFQGPLTAQLFKKLKNVVKEAAGETVQSRAAMGTEKTTNKVLDGSGKLGGLFKKHNRHKGASAENTDLGSVVDADATTAPAPVSMKSYQNYDFVPGDTIMFADDFNDDQDGEFPAHWDLKKGQAVVNSIKGTPAFLLTDGNYCQVLPRMKSSSYLGNAFTIEFDTYTDGQGDESPILYLTYVDKDGNNQDGEISFNRGDEDEGRGDISMSNFPNGLNADFPAQLRAGYINNWHHCALIYKDDQLKCYVDQFRVLSVPHLGVTPSAFGFEGIGEQASPVIITNVRLASGGSMNAIGKKFTDAKIVTHGITFDVDKSVIKPRSMGTLNMIVKVLEINPVLKFEIDGHTDNTGEASHNLQLSKDRATAVRAQLIQMGIDGARLSIKGYGDTKPISDNDSPEGRANNRRVEFVRM